MSEILLFGAGKSSYYLVDHLAKHAQKDDYRLTIADTDLSLAKEITHGNDRVKCIKLNIFDDEERKRVIQNAALVISLLPSTLHELVARDCIVYKKNFLNASYISPEIKELDTAAKDAGLLFLCETGLDPGIDHMSAMQIIHGIKEEGGEVEIFKSYCGGISESDAKNPWNYKFTWSPRNVVLAGQGTARYMQDGKIRYIPYQRIFDDIEKIKIPGLGNYEAYVNRDSLKYIKPYGIESALTVLRGTLRHKGFSAKWNVLVHLGITDDSFVIENSDKLTYKQFVESFLPAGWSFKDFMWNYFEQEKSDKDFKAIEWLGLLSNEKIGESHLTPAQILQKLLESRWKMKDEDRDLVVMYHELVYRQKKKYFTIQTGFELKGDGRKKTAMAKTVGLPLAYAARLILSKKIKTKGVVLPVTKDIYEPILKSLHEEGISFTHNTSNKNIAGKKGNSFKLFTF